MSFYQKPPSRSRRALENGAYGGHLHHGDQCHRGPGQPSNPQNNWKSQGGFQYWRNNPSQQHSFQPNGQQNNQQWQGGNRDWSNDPSQQRNDFQNNNFGTNRPREDNYPQKYNGNYPPQHHQQYIKDSRPRREHSYPGDRSNHSGHRKPQSRHTERFDPHLSPKLEVIEEDWDQEILQKSQMNHTGNHREPKIEPQENRDRNGHRNHNVSQNKTTDSMCCDQPMLKTLLQQINTPKPFQLSRHDITHVWYPPSSSNNTHEDRNRPNTPSNQRRNNVATSTSGVQRNSSANNSAVPLHQKGPLTQKNLNDNANKSASALQNKSTPSGDSRNTPAVLQNKSTPNAESHNTQTVLQNKSMPSGELCNTPTVSQNKSTSNVSSANSVPKLILQKSSVNPKDWSIRQSVDPNQQSSDPSHSAETSLMGNSSVININDLNPAILKQLTATPKTAEPVSDQNQLEQHQGVSARAICHDGPIMKASFLYAQNEELNRESLDIATSATTSNSSLTSSLTPSKEVNAILNSVSAPASQNKQIIKPGVLLLNDNSLNDKEKEPIIPTSTQIDSNDDNSDSDLSDDDDVSFSSTDLALVNGTDVTPVNSDTDLSGNESDSIDDNTDGRFSKFLSEKSPSPVKSNNETGKGLPPDNSDSELSGDDIDGLPVSGKSNKRPTSREKSSSSTKKKNRAEQLFAPILKKPRIASKNAKKTGPVNEEIIVIVDTPQNKKDRYLVTEEIIVLSDDEDDKETSSTGSTLQQPTALNRKGTSKITVSASSKEIHSSPQKEKKRKSLDSMDTQKTSKARKLMDEPKAKVSSIDRQKLEIVNSRVESRPVPVNQNLKRKIRPVALFSIKKSASMVVKKALPTQSLSSQPRGKLKNIIHNRELVVPLKRLTPAEILKFSASKNVVDKSTLLYERDVLNQVKYFVSFAYFHLMKDFNVSLTSEVNDPKDLCSRVLYISDAKSSALVKFIYLQESSDHNKITYKTLSNPEFDIRKIYKEFIDFRRNSSSPSLFSICTNLDVNCEQFRKNKVAVMRLNNRYTFSVEEGHELHKKFLNCLILPSLAELLAQCIKHGKNKNFNTELIKKYHLALVKENVLIIQTQKKSNGKVVHTARFHPNFVNQRDLSNGAKELHRHLLKSMSTPPSATMGFELTSDHFGKDCHLDPTPEIENLRGVAEALAYQDPNQLQALKNDLKKIVGHILLKEEVSIFGFSRQFSRNEKLPGNLNMLRRQLQVFLQYGDQNFNEFCSKKISIKDFCTDHPVQKLPDEDSDKLFKEFYHCFAFEKAEVYAHMLNKDILRIDDEACANAVQEELLEVIKMQNSGPGSLQSIQNLIAKHKVTSMLTQLQPQMDVQFDEELLNALQRKISQHGIALCITKSLVLSKLKIQQLFARIFQFHQGREILFVTNKTLLDMTNDVLHALAHKSTNILLVQWSEEVQGNGQLFAKIMKSLQNQCENSTSIKSVIIIGDQKSCSPLTNIIDTKIIDSEHSFDLSEDSKAKLLEADNISLQHRRLSLKSLLPDEHVATLLENPEILRLLLTGKLSIGKDIIRPTGYKESFFKAQIKQCIVINPAVFHESIEDVFLIRNIDRKDLEQYVPAGQRVLSPNDVPTSMRINARFILLGFNVPATFFDGYAEKNHHQHNVHLLRYEDGSFVWEKTQGNNTDLLRNRMEDTNDLYKSQRTMDVVKEGPKTVIICGDAGSGKSVCLYDIARKTKYLYKNSASTEAFWPMQVSLDRTRLSRFVKRDTNIPLELDFVEKFLPDYLELDEVQSKLLTMILKNQLKIKLVLLFDNYEELPSSHRRFVVQLLQELQISFCERVYVTSSPSTRSELEETLAVFAYSLEFSEVEKVQFLQSFWSKAGGDVDFTNEASDFVNHYEELSATPLKLRMLATMYTPDDEEDEEFKAVETGKELYKLYVEHKGLKDEESASLFSLRKLLDDDQLKSLNLQHKNPKKGYAMPDDLRHRTFYEYFAAKYLAAKNHSKCIDELLDSVSPLFFETYFTQLNAGDEMTKVIGEFAVNGHLNVVKMMLSHCKVKVQLSNVILSDNANAREVVRLLLEYYNDTKDDIMLHGEFKKAKYAESSIIKYVNRREKPRKETPLEVAAKLKKIPIACELLLKGANIKSINEEFTFGIARYIADEMSKPDDESAWLRPIAEKLFKLQPNAVAHLKKTSEYPRMLSYFFTHGRVELVNLLLKNDRERYNVLVAKVNDKSPLDLVNDSRVLSDDERLEIAKYIVSNVGDDMERRNRYYLGGVLKTAAECNHERTFEYFVGKYPEKHMGFLQSAMRSNRLDLIRFLMRKTDRMMYPDENTALHRAVSLGVSPLTINFLVNRGGIDNTNKNGETPLCVAFKEGQELELIEYLIKKDAHLFAKDELGLYPWCYAILDESKYSSEDQANIVKYLQDRVKLQAPETEQKISFESDQKRKEVARKVKFFQKPESFALPNLELHMALKSNDESWIRFLVQQGAKVNHTEADGRTPLHVAIEFKRYKLAKMLLDHGATFNVKDKNKLTPLKLLLKNGDESKESKGMKELLETATELFDGNEKYTASTSRHLLNCRDKDGRTLLHVAAKSGNRLAVREIIKQSKEHCIANNNFPALDVNAKDAKGNTALNMVKSQNVDVAKELLLNGAIFEPATSALLQFAGKLFEAVKDKDVERVRELVKNECLTNARDEAGKSCLHWAASYDSQEIVKLVLAVRVSDVDAMDSSLRTPLHYAVENDNIASVLLLLKAGASYDVKDKLGRRPFDVESKTNESVKLLWKIHQMFLDIKSDEPRILANDNPEALLEYLMEIESNWSMTANVAINVTDSKKNTLLHIAARYDFTTVVENLLRLGAIYNAKNKWKKTPESMAISTRQMFKSLTRAQEKRTVNSWINLDPEIVVNFRFGNGYVLLHDCAIEGRKEEVRWLVENRADVRATSNRGTKIRYNKQKFPEIFDILGEI